MAGRERHPVDASTYSGRLAVHIRDLRESKGLTVDQLADKSGIPRSTMYAFENGSRGIPADIYPVLAKALGVSAAAFLPPFPKK